MVYIDEDSNVVLASNEYAQLKVKSDGSIDQISFENNITANRTNISCDEIIINGHKLNPQFYNNTDMRNMHGSQYKAIGNMNIYSTVLVKTFDKRLKKEVLIRRPMLSPLFSPTINLPNAPEEYDIDTNISNELKVLKKKGVFNND